MDRWVGKVAIVTGASAGIGAAIAEELVMSGINVVGMARRENKMNEMVEKFGKYPGKFYSLKTDLTVVEDILASLKWVKDNVGPIHIVINNAGFLAEGGTFNGDLSVWKSQMDSMLLAPCIISQESIKDMIANNVDGHIINVNSIYGHVINHVYNPEMGIYPAIKHGISALTETTRQELVLKGKKIKISAISPGMTGSELFNGYPAEAIAKIPLLSCTDVSNAVMFMLSRPPHVQVQEMVIKPIGEIA
ncbi:PREDICTED: farnesol dehydrogenase-like [Nicrophorus vespilloides]|uniref:Farnesol dehydrogenase-like n=1 Tax=Nicrophorus vespilloides TaxID=110193 RepID=A0ABM1N2E6_NICVS|nr:PREDICTED: farnesol dehydrogenase-like [Nicrophorus vespilloides]XP_017781005.1 PREDICTED: farnesol dehydrogenase-like [Nicrophorus vespilloides]